MRGSRAVTRATDLCALATSILPSSGRSLAERREKGDQSPAYDPSFLFPRGQQQDKTRKTEGEAASTMRMLLQR